MRRLFPAPFRSLRGRLALLTFLPALVALATVGVLAYVVHLAVLLNDAERSARAEQLRAVGLAREIEGHRGLLHDVFAASALGDLSALRRATQAAAGSRQEIVASLPGGGDPALTAAFLSSLSDWAIDAALALNAGDPPLAQQTLEQLDAVLTSFAEARRSVAVAADMRAQAAAREADAMMQRAWTAGLLVCAVLAAGVGLALLGIDRTVQRPLGEILTEIEELEPDPDPSKAAEDPVERTFQALDRLSASVAARRRALAALATARDAAVEAYQVRADFLAAMSHELRTPLNAVIGFADALRMGAPGPLTTNKQKEYVGHILEAARDLLNLIENLLDLGRVDGGQKNLFLRPLDANRAVQAVYEALQPVADAAGVQFACSLTDGALMVIGEDRAMRRVLFNLASNAIKFTPTGGAVTLSTTVENDAGVIRITDTGRGMTPAQFESARRGERLGGADPYRRETPGAGLGLPIARSLAQAMGGSLSLEPAAPSGVVAALTTPLAAEEAA